MIEKYAHKVGRRQYSFSASLQQKMFLTDFI